MAVASLGSQGTQVEASDVYVMQFMLNRVTANGTVSIHHALCVSGSDTVTERAVCCEM
jgi:hypothetical protein